MGEEKALFHTQNPPQVDDVDERTKIKKALALVQAFSKPPKRKRPNLLYLNKKPRFRRPLRDYQPKQNPLLSGRAFCYSWSL
ncbi:hypothetical protein [Chryseobacterium sp. A321]